MNQRMPGNRMAGYDWCVSNYYADDVKPPKQPRELAIETVHKGLASRDVEVAASRSRTDLGCIMVTKIGGDPGGFVLRRDAGGEWISSETEETQP